MMLKFSTEWFLSYATTYTYRSRREILVGVIDFMLQLQDAFLFLILFFL